MAGWQAGWTDGWMANKTLREWYFFKEGGEMLKTIFRP